jgi:hypothetical protein
MLLEIFGLAEVPQEQHFINCMLQHTAGTRSQKVPHGRHFINQLIKCRPCGT